MLYDLTHTVKMLQQEWAIFPTPNRYPFLKKPHRYQDI